MFRCFAILILMFIAGCCDANREAVYQVSTIDALLDGVYDGEYTLGSLLKKGDLGIGTFDALEGEMVVLDSVVYQVKADGTIKRMPASTTTPFAAVTYFDKDMELVISDVESLEDLCGRIKEKLPNKNLFYAVRIDGLFEYVKTRSVPAQSKPYPKLAEVVKTQKTFEAHDTRGTIVGFYCPDFVKGVNVTGFHLHYISAARKFGGHILDVKTGEVKVKLDETRGFEMSLPSGECFAEADLSADRTQELRKVEK